MGDVLGDCLFSLSLWRQSHQRAKSSDLFLRTLLISILPAPKTLWHRLKLKALCDVVIHRK